MTVVMAYLGLCIAKGLPTCGLTQCWSQQPSRPRLVLRSRVCHAPLGRYALTMSAIQYLMRFCS